MAWFESVSPDALVVAGSYGDSVGRGEFSGSSLLELRGLRPFNTRGLLLDGIAAHAQCEVQLDLTELHTRAAEPRRYAKLEIEQQGQYMRGMIAHMMSVINNYCTLYQAFTAPEVYSYIWSLHPAARTDEVYVELIRKLGNELIAIPWARTNRTIDNGVRPVVLYRQASPSYHQYPAWMARELREAVRDSVNPAWFADTGLFNERAVRQVVNDVLERDRGVMYQARRDYDVVSWLWSLRYLVDDVLPAHPVVSAPQSSPAAVANSPATARKDGRSALRRKLAEIPFLLRHSRRLRKWWLRRLSLRQYRPEYD